MAISVGDKKDEISAEPNVVPLCDVLLVLLIIFMVVTPLVQKGIDVRLPTALNTIGMPENPEVVLYIRKDGSMFLNQEKATYDNLPVLLEDAFMTASDNKLYLKADQDLEYGLIIDLIEVIKNSGVEVMGIIAEKKTEKMD